MDLIYVSVIVVFFAMTLGLVKLCGVLGGGQ